MQRELYLQYTSSNSREINESKLMRERDKQTDRHRKKVSKKRMCIYICKICLIKLAMPEFVERILNMFAKFCNILSPAARYSQKFHRGIQRRNL